MNDETVIRLAEHFRISAEQLRAEHERTSQREPKGLGAKVLWVAGMSAARVGAEAYEEARRSLLRLSIDPNVGLPTDVVWERPDAKCARCGEFWSPERDDLIPSDALCGVCLDADRAAQPDPDAEPEPLHDTWAEERGER